MLIPHDIFSRAIPSVWWNHTDGIAPSVLTGVLVASCASPVAGGTLLPGDDDIAAAARSPWSTASPVGWRAP